MPEIVCFFSPQSGYAYLGHDRLLALAARHGAKIRWRPVDILTVFAESQTTPPAKQSPIRAAYRRSDMARFAKLRSLPLNPSPPFWPTQSAPACRMIIAADVTGDDPANYVGAVLKAIWARDLDISSIETLISLAGEVGFDGADLARLAATPAIQAKLQEHTAEAIAAGVFGSPSYVVGGELFWGQDRLDFVSAKLAEVGS